MVKNIVKRLRDKQIAHMPCGYRLCGEAADALEQMERDFREYIGGQVSRKSGVYACCYCSNREPCAIGCKHEECDGVRGWEYGTPKGETE